MNLRLLICKIKTELLKIKNQESILSKIIHVAYGRVAILKWAIVIQNQ